MTDTLRTRIARLTRQLTSARQRGQSVHGHVIVPVRDDDVDAAVDAMDELAELEEAADRLDGPDRRRRHLRSVGGGGRA